MWSTCQTLSSTTEVPTLAARGTYLNSDGEGIEEALGLFFPYSGDQMNFNMRGGYFGDDLFILVEWDDPEDSRDRVSWYFDQDAKLWKSEHKFANDVNDKFYEDKFAFQFPIGDVTGFAAQTCYASCHQNLPIVEEGHPHTKHFLNVDGEKVDMWHWKRVRGAYADQADDKYIGYDDINAGNAANGRHADAGSSGYSSNKQTLNNGVADVNVPKYVIPDATDYYWISQDDIDNGTAKLITGVDENGVLTYDGGTIDPAGDSGYDHATGNKRFPSVTVKPFTEHRGEITVKAQHTGTGWVAEITRKLNTGDENDVAFDLTQEYPFGFAIFNRAAIAHSIKPGLLLKFEQ